MSGCEKNGQDADLLLERMRLVRTAGYSHVDELQEEARRLVDWREYVLTKPLVSIAAASLFGFALTSGTLKAVSKKAPPSSANFVGPDSQSSRKPTFTGGVMDLATSIASSAVKNYVANLVQRLIAERSSTSDRLHELNTKV